MGAQQIWGGQYQVDILGSSSQTLKYVILHTATVKMFNFIEADDRITLLVEITPWGGPRKFQGGRSTQATAVIARMTVVKGSGFKRQYLFSHCLGEFYL